MFIFSKLLTYVRTHAEADNPYQNFLKFYTLKEAVYDLAKCWDELPLSIIAQSYNNLLKNNLLKEGFARDFEGFWVNNLVLEFYLRRLWGNNLELSLVPRSQIMKGCFANEVQELVSIFNGLTH